MIAVTEEQINREKATKLLRKLYKLYMNQPRGKDSAALADLWGAEEALKAAGVFTYEEMSRLEITYK